MLAGVAVEEVEPAAQQRAHALAARCVEAREHAVVDLAAGLDTPPVNERDRQLLDVPPPRPEHLGGVAGAAGEGQARDPDERAEEGEQPHQRQPAEAGRLEHDHRGVPLGQVAGQRHCPGAAAAGGRRAEMADPGGRHHEHPPADEVGAPAQVEVVAERRDALVEAADGRERAAPHQHPRGGDEEHVADLVVLALVDLVVLDRGDRPAGPVDRPADLGEAPRVVPGDELGAEDAGARPGLGLGEEPLERFRLGGGVVVEQPQPVHAGGALVAERAHDGAAELAADGEDGVGAEAGARPVGAAVRRPGVDDHDVVDRAGLGGQPAEGVPQEWPPVVHDDHCQDPWSTHCHCQAPRRGGSAAYFATMRNARGSR